MRTLRMHRKDSATYKAETKNCIVNQKGELIYLELIGQHSKDHKDLKLIIDEIKEKYGITLIFEGGEYIHRKQDGYVSKIEDIGNGMGYAYIYHEPSLKGKSSNILLGRTEEEVLTQWKKWLSESQPLPYPHGYKEDLGMEAEQHLLNKIVGRKWIKKLSKEGDEILAYEISSKVLTDIDKTYGLQEVILEVVKESSLLEIDRIRKILKTAPRIGESDTDAAKVYTVIKNIESNKIYNIIECDSESDDVFCLIDNNGSIEWEEYNLEDLFTNSKNTVLKGDQYENLYLDTSGNKVQKA